MSVCSNKATGPSLVHSFQKLNLCTTTMHSCSTLECQELTKATQGCIPAAALSMTIQLRLLTITGAWHLGSCCGLFCSAALANKRLTSCLSSFLCQFSPAWLSAHGSRLPRRCRHLRDPQVPSPCAGPPAADTSAAVALQLPTLAGRCPAELRGCTPGQHQPAADTQISRLAMPSFEPAAARLGDACLKLVQPPPPPPASGLHCAVPGRGGDSGGRTHTTWGPLSACCSQRLTVSRCALNSHCCQHIRDTAQSSRQYSTGRYGTIAGHQAGLQMVSAGLALAKDLVLACMMKERRREAASHQSTAGTHVDSQHAVGVQHALLEVS